MKQNKTKQTKYILKMEEGFFIWSLVLKVSISFYLFIFISNISESIFKNDEKVNFKKIISVLQVENG